MGSLILHNTSTAQWHSLLGEAQEASAIYLKTELESYLVFMLIRFMRDPNIAASVLGLEFLSSYQAHTHKSTYYHRGLSLRQEQLRAVGDKCLLFAGLFPERALKKRVKLSYFVKLGQTAYKTLSSYLETQEDLFCELVEEFPRLMDVLQATRGTSSATVDLLHSLELWHETRSPAAWQRICKATSSNMTFIPPYDPDGLSPHQKKPKH